MLPQFQSIIGDRHDLNLMERHETDRWRPDQSIHTSTDSSICLDCSQVLVTMLLSSRSFSFVGHLAAWRIVHRFFAFQSKVAIRLLLELWGGAWLWLCWQQRCKLSFTSTAAEWTCLRGRSGVSEWRWLRHPWLCFSGFTWSCTSTFKRFGKRRLFKRWPYVFGGLSGAGYLCKGHLVEDSVAMFSGATFE